MVHTKNNKRYEFFFFNVSTIDKEKQDTFNFFPPKNYVLIVKNSNHISSIKTS